MKIYSFEKFEFWQHARQWAIWTYHMTKKFPAEEKFGLITEELYIEGRNLIEKQTFLIAQLRKSQNLNKNLS